MRKEKVAAILNLDEPSELLNPIVKGRIIASLPYGCRYRLIDFPFSSLSDAEIASCALFVNGNSQSLYDHIRDGYVWSLDSSIGGGVFTYSIDEHFYDNQINYCLRSKAKQVLVMGSRVLCNIDLNELINHHLNTNADVTYVKNNEFLLNIALFNTSKYIYYLRLSKRLGLRGDIDTLLKLAEDNNDYLKSYEYQGYFKNIDNIKSYYEANMDLLHVEKYESLFNDKIRIITRPKNGAPTYFASSSNVMNSSLASDCFIEGTVEHSILFRKVKVGKEALVKNSIIMHQCQIGEGAKLEYVILDKEVKVLPGVTLRGTKEKPLVIEKNTVILNEVEV